MRPLEVLLTVSTVAVLALAPFVSRRHPRWLCAAGFFLLLIAGAQIEFEGARWQMWPLYLAAVLFTLFSLIVPARRWLSNRRLRFALVVLAASGAALGLVYPVFRLPRPTGPSPVGTITLTVRDRTRSDPYSARPAGPREIVVQFWYPAAPGPGHFEPYRNRRTASFRDQQLRLVKTHSIAGAKLSSARERYPVILYSPSWHGLRNQSMAQIEELASHGFVVAGIDHPYGSSVTVFPDGRVIYARPSGFLDVSSDAALLRSEENDGREARIRAADAVSVLNFLATLDDSASGLTAGRLDLGAVGIYGYSFGGAVAAEACWMDPRFKACGDLDGDVFAEAYREGIHQPFLLISGDGPVPTERQIAAASPPRRRDLQVDRDQTQQLFSTTQRNGGVIVEIHGVEHGNFSDGALFSPVPYLAGTGSIDRRRGIAIVNAYVLAFFRRYLLGSAEPLLSESPAAYPEVRVNSFPAPPLN